MTRNRWLGPLDPIFDDTKRKGALATGNTPGVDYDYDYVLLNIVGGTVWYVQDPGPFATVSWLSFAAAMAGDIRNEASGYGLWYFDAWYDESGVVPATYDLTVENAALGAFWVSYLQPFTTYTAWQTFAAADSGDIRNESSGYGLRYFNAWWDESGESRTYDDAVADIGGLIWYSTLDDLDSATAGVPLGGTVTTPGDGYRYHTFLQSNITAGDNWFWTNDPTGTFEVERFALGSGASGGRATGTQWGGGGGAGQPEVLTAYVVPDGGERISIGNGGAIQGSQGTQGNDGGDVVITAADGSVDTIQGGSGGGVPGVSSGAGKSSGGPGGGGGAATGVSGAGGIDSSGSNDGGDGAGSATAADNRAGGGGGAGGPGVSGVAGGQLGTGGPGFEWPPGSGQLWGGGGAGSPGAGTALGGSGGGGNASASGSGGSATANTGSGGGGSFSTTQSGAGSAGRVAYRYLYP